MAQAHLPKSTEIVHWYKFPAQRTACGMSVTVAHNRRERVISSETDFELVTCSRCSTVLTYSRYYGKIHSSSTKPKPLKKLLRRKDCPVV